MLDRVRGLLRHDELPRPSTDGGGPLDSTMVLLPEVEIRAMRKAIGRGLAAPLNEELNEEDYHRAIPMSRTECEHAIRGDRRLARVLRRL